MARYTRILFNKTQLFSLALMSTMLLLGSVHAISQPLYEDQVEDSADDPIAVQGLIERFNESAQLSPDSVESLLQKDADPKDPFCSTRPCSR